jgi:hypothetical protein
MIVELVFALILVCLAWKVMGWLEWAAAAAMILLFVADLVVKGHP